MWRSPDKCECESALGMHVYPSTRSDTRRISRRGRPLDHFHPQSCLLIPQCSDGHKATSNLWCCGMSMIAFSFAYCNYNPTSSACCFRFFESIYRPMSENDFVPLWNPLEDFSPKSEWDFCMSEKYQAMKCWSTILRHPWHQIGNHCKSNEKSWIHLTTFNRI